MISHLRDKENNTKSHFYVSRFTKAVDLLHIRYSVSPCTDAHERQFAGGQRER